MWLHSCGKTYLHHTHSIAIRCTGVLTWCYGAQTGANGWLGGANTQISGARSWSAELLKQNVCVSTHRSGACHMICYKCKLCMLLLFVHVAIVCVCGAKIDLGTAMWSPTRKIISTPGMGAEWCQAFFRSAIDSIQNLCTHILQNRQLPMPVELTTCQQWSSVQ